MGQIITFYSYKGGVGRSMALANIGYELSVKGKKTLLVDWDLEAPGLERYFSKFSFEKKSDNGLIHILRDFKDDKSPNYKDFIWKTEISPTTNLDLLTSGRATDASVYSNILQNFDWDVFFKDSNGGLHLENLRNQWLNDYDFVLIDSRTGLTDSSGICTILMPDILVAMFTANLQSLFGIRDIVSFINGARQRLDVDRMALTILPIPSRFGTRVEFKESQEWLIKISDLLGDCFSSWLPKWIAPIHILEKIKIPQIDYFTFGEKLAVVEQGTNDPEGMGYIFSQISNLLISDFKDLKGFLGPEMFDSLKHEFSNSDRQESSERAEYDVFLSYPRELYPWVKDLFVPSLNEYLREDLGYYPNIFTDEDEIIIGSDFKSKIDASIEKAKTYILIFTEDFNYKKRQYSHFEIERILEKEKHEKRAMVFPIFFNMISRKNSGFTIDNSLARDFELLRERFVLDLSPFQYDETLNSTRARAHFAREIEKLSEQIFASIKVFNKGNKEELDSFRKMNFEYEQLILLAMEYEKIRELMQSGSKRTSAMQSVFKKMINHITDPSEYLHNLMKSESPGARLAAIAALHKFPSLDQIPWLAERVGFQETPFVGYQASVGLFIASRTFGKEKPSVLIEALYKAQSNIDQAEYKDPNQYSNINAAIHNLK